MNRDGEEEGKKRVEEDDRGTSDSMRNLRKIENLRGPLGSLRGPPGAPESPRQKPESDRKPSTKNRREIVEKKGGRPRSGLRGPEPRGEPSAREEGSEAKRGRRSRAHGRARALLGRAHEAVASYRAQIEIVGEIRPRM